MFGFLKDKLGFWKQAKASATDMECSFEAIKEARKKEHAEFQKIQEAVKRFESFMLERECKKKCRG